MFPLLLSVVFGSSFGLTIKWVQNRQREDLYSVGALNYLVGFAFSIPFFLGWLSFPGLEPATDEAGRWWVAAVCGGTMGISYFTAYFFVTYCIRQVGVPATSVVGSLSILVPISCGILIWRESPTTMHYVGMLLAMSALLLIAMRPPRAAGLASTAKGAGGSPGSDRAALTQHVPAQPAPSQPAANSGLKLALGKWLAPLALAGFFVLAGTNRLTQETFKHESVPQLLPVFLFFAFGLSSLPSLRLLVKKRRWPTPGEFAFGFYLGMANFMQSYGVLSALQHLDGYIVYPAVSAGSLVVTTTVASTVLGDSLDRWTAAGVGLAVSALILLRAF